MSSSHSSQLPVPADPGLILRDFIVFQLKLAADGLRDVVAINLSIIAIVVDLVIGRGGKFGLFYGVVRLSKRFEISRNSTVLAISGGLDSVSDGRLSKVVASLSERSE